MNLEIPTHTIRTRTRFHVLLFSSLALLCAVAAPPCSALELTGLSVTPHHHSPRLRYRRPPDPGLGARVELFLRNNREAPLTIGPDFPRASMPGYPANCSRAEI